MPDFQFGYLCARTGEDLAGLVERILVRESSRESEPKAAMAFPSPPGTQLAELDYILHFGHGKPWQIDGGMTGQQITGIELPKSPVVFSGACFTGVLSRSYHRCAYQRIYMKPATISPDRLVSLSWVHAGVSGYFAALEGDRGEMAIAEWDRFRETAAPLGQVMGYQYRLAFTSLPADYEGFPRYIPGHRKRTGFYDVMLRGMVSRILLSDPSFRPLMSPLEKPATAVEVARDEKEKTLTVKVTVKRWSKGQFLNYLPKSGKGIFDRRLYARVPVPEDLRKAPEDPQVRVELGGQPIELTRHHVRYEVWGGRRYLNLQVESTDRRLGQAGSQAVWTFTTP
jgi:hypothetical protein